MLLTVSIPEEITDGSEFYALSTILVKTLFTDLIFENDRFGLSLDGSISASRGSIQCRLESTH